MQNIIVTKGQKKKESKGKESIFRFHCKHSHCNSSNVYCMSYLSNIIESKICAHTGRYCYQRMRRLNPMENLPALFAFFINRLSIYDNLSPKDSALQKMSVVPPQIWEQ